MMRTFMVATAVSGLLLSTVLAETPANPHQNGAMNSAKEHSAASTQAITQQAPSQWLGSQLIGLDVVGANNEQIGDVNDILVDKSGKVDALVVGVGGFLGMGEKNVALPMTAFEIVPANSGSNKTSSDQLRLSMSKDQLQKHSEFKKLNNARARTGAGSASEPASKPASAANPSANRGAGSPPR